MNPSDDALCRTIWNAIPIPVFVVDEDVRITDLNEVASTLTGHEKAKILRQRGGEVLHCLHSADVPEGCGRAPFCQHCVIRNSVKACLRGQTVSRSRMKMEFLSESGLKPMELLITVSPISEGEGRQVVLILEDITEMTTLRNIIPICMKCKKIRNDAKYWQTVEQYFHEHVGVDFSHGICPECTDKFYPEFRRPEAARPGGQRPV